MTTEFLFALTGAIVGAGVLWFLTRSKPNDRASLSHQQLADQINQLAVRLDSRLDESKSFVASRVSSTEKSLRQVSHSLGKLEQTTHHLGEATRDISNFQQLLKNPKTRGNFGEVLLNNLLSDILPHDRYQTQFTFSDGGVIADAIIKLQDNYIVAIDSKFPLTNHEAGDGKALARDIKKHITDISKKYISPQAKTLDYAFMYIPFEGIYYQTFVQDTQTRLWEFALAHKVIPVSPNSFLAYLHTILVGLRGMKIEEQTKEILEHLGQVRNDFGKFSEDFSVVGKHLANAKNKYDESTRRLDKFSNRLDQIEHESSPSPNLPLEN